MLDYEIPEKGCVAWTMKGTTVITRYVLLVLVMLFRNIFSLETIWLHHEGNSDLVELDPYNFKVCVEKNGIYI
jgi:hypothetical protein